MKRRTIFQLLLITGLLFTFVTACDKTDDPSVEIESAETVKDADGNKYTTVKIGTQEWMVENLKTTKYNDGTQIPNVPDYDDWWNLTSGAYCNYHNVEINAVTYGRLYNWYAVNTGKLAPKGWHVPTDDDWTILIKYLIANGYNYDGTKGGNKIAKSLCAKTNWKSGSEGTPGAAPENNNSSGFTALPGGYRAIHATIDFEYILIVGQWWSSREDNEYNAYCVDMNINELGLMRAYSPKVNGFSVRLVKD